MPSSVFDSPAFSRNLFFPFDDARTTPVDARDRMIPVAPDVRLHLRVHTLAGARGTVLLFHGNGELVADYDSFAHHYRGAGFELAVVDYRGYGRSEGWPTFRSMIEDVRVILEHVRDDACGDGKPLVVLGRSLGSACAAETCRLADPCVRGVVIESGFGDLASFVARRGVKVTEPLPEADWRDFDPLRKLRGWSRPLLVMHGALDTLIAPNDGKLLYEAAPEGNKRWVAIEGHGHNDVLAADAYWEAVRAFLDECAGAS